MISLNFNSSSINSFESENIFDISNNYDRNQNNLNLSARIDRSSTISASKYNNYFNKESIKKLPLLYKSKNTTNENIQFIDDIVSYENESYDLIKNCNKNLPFLSISKHKII